MRSDLDSFPVSLRVPEEFPVAVGVSPGDPRPASIPFRRHIDVAQESVNGIRRAPATDRERAGFGAEPMLGKPDDVKLLTAVAFAERARLDVGFANGQVRAELCAVALGAGCGLKRHGASCACSLPVVDATACVVEQARTVFRAESADQRWEADRLSGCAALFARTIEEHRGTSNSAVLSLRPVRTVRGLLPTNYSRYGSG